MLWALVITQLFGIKEIKQEERKKQEERRTILEKKNSVKYTCTLQKILVLLKDGKQECWERSQKTRLDHLYWVKRKGYKRAAEELKQQIKAKAATLKWYKNRVKQYQENRLLQPNSQSSIRNWMESIMKRI